MNSSKNILSFLHDLWLQEHSKTAISLIPNISITHLLKNFNYTATIFLFFCEFFLTPFPLLRASSPLCSSRLKVLLKLPYSYSLSAVSVVYHGALFISLSPRNFRVYISAECGAVCRARTCDLSVNSRLLFR